MLISILISFFTALILIPVIIALCKKFKIYDTINSRKVHKGNIPRLGGLGFVTAFTIGSVYYLVTQAPGSWSRLVSMIVAGIIIFVFGVIDDFKEMKGKLKFIIQAAAAVVVVIAGYRFKNIFGFELGWIGYPLTFCWIIGVINSFNLIDGIDGLCGGLSFLIFITIGVIELPTSPTTGSLAFIMAGALLGFLIFNKPTAKIFMGDGGSQFLGFLIAVLPLYENVSNNEPNKFAMIALLAAVPIFDCIAAMWRRTREKRSFFDADKAHLHHKLMNLGYHVPQILILLYSIQFFLCFMVYLSDFIGGKTGVLILCAGFIAMTLFFTLIHYTNKAVLASKKPGYKSDIDKY